MNYRARQDAQQPRQWMMRDPGSGGQHWPATWTLGSLMAAPCEVGKSPTEGEMMSDDYVGLPEDEATVQAYNNGFDVVRIISRDGNYFPVTRDYREDRINFNIEETLVVQASVG